MEKVYYPSVRKVFLHSYLYPVLSLLAVSLLSAFISYLRKGTFDINDSLVSYFLLAIFPFIFIQGMINGFTGKLLAIKLTSKSVSGPLHVGRDMPIPFTEIDFEKTRKKKRICSIHGDEFKFEEKLFDEEDVKEIWGKIYKHEKRKK